MKAAFRDGQETVERTLRLWLSPDDYDAEDGRKVGRCSVEEEGFALDFRQDVWKVKGFGDLPEFAARKTVVSRTFDIHGDPSAHGTSTLTLEIGPKGAVSATLESEGVDEDGPVRERAEAKGSLIVTRHAQDPDRYEAQVSLAFKGVGVLEADVELRVSADGKVHAEDCAIVDCTDFADWGE